MREAATAPIYRLWSIGDRYPGMMRAREGGAALAVEVWQVEAHGLVQILEREPPGLVMGRVQLEDGSQVWGVLAESYLVERQAEITSYGGWRAYMAGQTRGVPASPMTILTSVTVRALESSLR